MQKMEIVLFLWFSRFANKKTTTDTIKEVEQKSQAINHPTQPQPISQPQSQPQIPTIGFNNQQFQGFGTPQNPAPQVQPQLDINNEIVSGHAHKAEIIAELEGMGFERVLIEQALVAAFYNKDRAIDYLLNVKLLGYS